MVFGYFILAVALLIESVGAYYSITGLAAIFSGALIPILIMGGSLEVGKVTAAVWLKSNWHRASRAYKIYLLPAVAMLMMITSIGIFGFLSKAHSDQSLVSGDVTSKLEIYEEKIKTAKENIESDRKQIKQMDEAVDQVMARSTTEGGADKSNAIRKSQARDRASLARDIEANQKIISQLNDQAAPIRAEVRKVEADVGPIKYIAKLIYGDNPDANVLEKAVVWIILIIVAVFDPLALVLILAAQQTLRWAKEDQDPVEEQLADTIDLKETEPENYTSTIEDLEPVVPEPIEFPIEELVLDDGEDVPGDAPIIEDRNTHIPIEDYYRGITQDEYYVDPYIDDSTQPPIPESNTAITEPVLEKPEEQPTFISRLLWPESNPDVQVTLPVEEPVDPLAGVVIPEIHPDDYLHKLAKSLFLAGRPGEDERMYHAQHQAGEIAQLPWHTEEHINNLPISDRERSELIKRFVKKDTVTSSSLGLEPDNVPNKPSGEVRGFGTQFPLDPNKGDMFLRVDRLPTVLYKYNGINWIEVDKTLTDTHAYDQAYIDHLISKIDSGEYDPDLLSDAERDSIEQRLRNL